jgi:hypothetical protein
MNGIKEITAYSKAKECNIVINENRINRQSKHNSYSLSLAFDTCFELNKSIIRSLFEAKHVIKAYETAYNLCFD